MAEKSLKIEEITPPADLFDRIMLRLADERRFRTARRKFIIALALSAIVFAIGIPLASSVAYDFIHSGFSTYASLLLSDFGTVMQSWQDFGLSLLESFPVMDTAFFVAIILTFLLAVRSVVVYGQSVFHYHSPFPLAHK